MEVKAEEEEVEEVAGSGSQQWANIELHTSSSDEVEEEEMPAPRRRTPRVWLPFYDYGGGPAGQG